jgi:hypothetical protein
MKVGEIARALKVAEEYGTRLDAKSRNLKPGALDQLLASFPSHSFVIDYDEARDLFHSIRKPTPNESELIRHINRAVTRGQADNSIIQFISEEPAVPSEQSNEHTQNGRTDPEGEGTPASEVVGAAGAAKAENNGAVVAGTSHGER